ncbi:MAG: hypothetical protein U9Q91_01675 [Candidatus Marinimicrobia bacterium]|nr:hypothetical protein [Candidatus Neomarinimicrobiota bacterium]
MKPLKLKTSMLIASIYAAVFYGVTMFINKVCITIGKPSMDKIHSLQNWKAWTPFIMGTIAILLFGLLVYQTDWKKKR